MKKSGMFGRAWSGLKQYPVIYHAVLILLLFAAVAIVSYISLAFGTRHGMKRRVPDFIGLRLNDAQYYASRRGLNIIVNDSLYVPAYPGGIVLDQLPKGGVDVKSGRKIYVTINSFRQKRVPLPYVAGRSLRQAKNMLEGAGLGIRELIYVEDIATNYVLAEYYEDTEITAESDMKVEKGSNVTLHVGVASADERSVVPYLIGRRMFEAKGRLWEIGLNVGEVFYDEDITMLTLDDARVYQQGIMPGKEQSLGSRVSLHLTLDKEKVAAAAAEYERLEKEALAAQALADSLAMVAADSLRMLELQREPQAELPSEPKSEPTPIVEDEFFM